jgi:hypothetical protein
MYRGCLGSSSSAFRICAIARVRALSETATPSQTVLRISSFGTSRWRFSTRNCSSRKDFGSSGRTSPETVSLRFEMSN